MGRTPGGLQAAHIDGPGVLRPSDMAAAAGSGLFGPRIDDVYAAMLETGSIPGCHGRTMRARNSCNHGINLRHRAAREEGQSWFAVGRHTDTKRYRLRATHVDRERAGGRRQAHPAAAELFEDAIVGNGLADHEAITSQQDARELPLRPAYAACVGKSTRARQVY